MTTLNIYAVAGLHLALYFKKANYFNCLSITFTIVSTSLLTNWFFHRLSTCGAQVLQLTQYVGRN